MLRILKYKCNISPFVWEVPKVDVLAMFIFTLGLSAKCHIFIFNRYNVIDNFVGKVPEGLLKKILPHGVFEAKHMGGRRSIFRGVANKST